MYSSKTAKCLQQLQSSSWKSVPHDVAPGCMLQGMVHGTNISMKLQLSTITNNLKVTWQLSAVITKCETINHLHDKSHFAIVKNIYMYIYWLFLTRAKCCATDVGHQQVCCKSSWMWLMLERLWLMFGWEHLWVQVSFQDGVTNAQEMICKKQVLFYFVFAKQRQI